MSKKINLLGQRFGRLVVIAEAPTVKGKANWLCRCDCGNEKIVLKDSLLRGHTRSCGCLYIESASKLNKKHGKSNTRMFHIWQSMRHRCSLEHDRAYKNYGGRGIKVCEEWDSDFMNFYNWAIASGYTENLTLDRIDVNGNYEPSNCRWVDMKVQGNNRRVSRMVEYHGNTDTLSNMCRKLNVNIKVIRSRMERRGISFERAIDDYNSCSPFREWKDYISTQ